MAGSLNQGVEYDSFPSTHWSQVGKISDTSSQDRIQALENLLRAYLPAMRSFLVYARKIDPSVAEDILQSFLTRKVLEEGILAKAQAIRGSFRAFLSTSLRNYASNCLKSPKWAGLPQTHVDSVLDLYSQSAEPADVFDIEWARQLLGQAVQTMKEHCVAIGRPDIWGVFEVRILKTCLGNEPPVSYDTLVEQFGFRSPAQASNVLVTANRMFIRILRTIVGSYEKSEAEIDEEILDLKRILTQASAG